MENQNIRKKRKLLILRIALMLSIIAMITFAALLAWEFYTRQAGQSFYDEVAVGFKPSLNQEAPDQEPFVDFDALREIMPDIVGWLQSYGTPINYPIVQGRDNDFYLRHLPDKSRNKLGSIFLDYRNAADFSDQNILIYGHNTDTGDIFGSFKNYRNQQYFEAHSSMFIFTPSADYELILFAGYLLDSAHEVPPMKFDDEAQFEQFISNIKRRSVFKSDTDVNFSDQIVFLCTCTTGGSRNERLIIVGKLAEI